MVPLRARVAEHRDIGVFVQDGEADRVSFAALVVVRCAQRRQASRHPERLAAYVQHRPDTAVLIRPAFECSTRLRRLHVRADENRLLQQVAVRGDEHPVAGICHVVRGTAENRGGTADMFGCTQAHRRQVEIAIGDVDEEQAVVRALNTLGPAPDFG